MGAAASLCRHLLAGLAATVAVGAGDCALAQDIFSRDTLSGQVDVRAVAGDQLTSFVDGGYGRGRFGDGRQGARLAEIAVVWNPSFGAGLDAVVAAEHQDGQSNGADISEAYLRYRTGPGAVGFTARAGLFWPWLSLEHDGLDWTVPDTITPSAINSWVGEEVKVAGIEASLRAPVLGQDMTFTAGAFTHGDTSGTLLTFRGWGLHDLKSTLNGEFNLPPLSPYMATRQRAQTTSILEIDSRVGVYGNLIWRTPGGAEFNLFTYDNEGDRIGVTPLVEWAWATRFTEAGASIPLTDKLHLKAQAMRGTTLMGYPGPEGIWVDIDFSSAFVALTRDIGKASLTGRVDAFGVTDNSTRTLDNNDEHGWAGTLAWRQPLSTRADLVVEGVVIHSIRPSRPTPRDTEATLQTALRWRF